MERAAYAPDKRCPHKILTSALIAAVQDRMVYFYFRLLQLDRHHIKNVFTLARLRDKQLTMLMPAVYTCG